jgi:diguanylate cyclase (GGDEF)-like protein
MLVVASLAFAVIVYGATRLSERTNDARIAAAVAAELALRDPLTGAHTRFALDQRFEQELARARRGGPPLAVYFLDLDGFKGVNDTLGHATGDALLRAFAERILGTVRASDTVARYGGDEFVVLANVADEAEAHALATRLVAATAEPVVADGARLELGVCIGLALHPVDGVDRPSLIHAADAAMYAAKAAGRRRWMGAPRRAAAGPRPSEPRLDAICASCG